MPVPFAALLGGLLKGGGVAARGALGGMMRTGASAQFVSGMHGVFAKRRAAIPRRYSPFPSSMHAHQGGDEEDQPSRLQSAGIAGGGLLKASAGLTGFVTSVGLATQGVAALANVVNNKAVENLKFFNSQIAALSWRQEAFGIQQNIKRGALVQGSTTELGDALMRADAAGAKYKAFFENVGNRLGITSANLKTGFYQAMDDIGIGDLVTAANKWLGAADVPQANNLLLKWLDDAANIGALHENDRSLLNRHPNEGPGGRF